MPDPADHLVVNSRSLGQRPRTPDGRNCRADDAERQADGAWQSGDGVEWRGPSFENTFFTFFEVPCQQEAQLLLGWPTVLPHCRRSMQKLWCIHVTGRWVCDDRFYGLVNRSNR